MEERAHVPPSIAPLPLPEPAPLSVLRAVADTVRTGGRDVIARFEGEVQRLFGVRGVRLREFPLRQQARLVTPTRTADAVVLAVPNADPRLQAVLEVMCDPDRPIGAAGLTALASCADLGALVLEVARTRDSVVAPPDGGTTLVGSSPMMQALRERVQRVAITDFTVLIEGESGTGKELVAHQLHECSRRRSGPFVAVNCAALVETLLEAELFGIEERTATGVRGRRGKFEAADGGTLFLDEISDLSLAAQAKLLRVMQDLSVERVGGHGTRRVNIRVVAATNRPLLGLVEQRLFRADLYYRLCGVEITVPPLRDRAPDIPELARHFLARYARTFELSASALDALGLHAWPGNVRELERVVERAVALARGSTIDLDDLPPHVSGQYGHVIGPALAGGDSMRAWGSRYARLVYERCGGNKRRACELLDISYHTLQAYLRYGHPDLPGAVGQLPAWVRSESSGPDRPPGD